MGNNGDLVGNIDDLLGTNRDLMGINGDLLGINGDVMGVDGDLMGPQPLVICTWLLNIVGLEFDGSILGLSWVCGRYIYP